MAIFGKIGFWLWAFWTVSLFFELFLGQLSNVNSFRFGDRTGSKHSCSTIVDGKMYIFGGRSDKDYSDQISLVEDCGLTRVGTLPIKFSYGSCNTFQTSNGESHTLLCFGLYGKSECHRYFKFHKNNKF